MIFRVICAFVNTRGAIEMESNDFSASGVSTAKVAAQEYFTDKYPGCNQFIFTDPEPHPPRSEVPSMTQLNYGRARGVQIAGNASGATIITGDSIQGGLHVGDRIELS